MEPIKTQQELRATILRLEIDQAEQGRILKEEFHAAYRSIKPANIILDTLKDLGDSSFVKDGFLNTTVGLGTGYLSKVVFQGVVNSPIKKILGSALMFGITNIVAKNPDAIKSLGTKIFSLFRKHPKKVVIEIEKDDIFE